MHRNEYFCQSSSANMQKALINTTSSRPQR